MFRPGKCFKGYVGNKCDLCGACIRDAKNREKQVIEKAEKFDEILSIFHNQPHQVIQWTPDKTQYSWNYPFTAKGEKMLHNILEILTRDENKKRSS